MFEYEKDTQGNYWIWSDKISGKFGPFQGVFVKNAILGNFPATIDMSPYPGYQYSLGISNARLFVISLNGLVDIKKLDISEK